MIVCMLMYCILMYTDKRNLVITIIRILFSILMQYLVDIKHNNSNQSFDNNY